MKRLLQIICLILAIEVLGAGSVIAQFQQMPMLGEQVDWSNPLSKGLIGLWLMNEGSGNTVFDLSGNGNHGEFQGDEYWQPGLHGQAIYFPGVTDWIDVGDKPTLEGMTQLTIVASVRADDASSQQTVISKPNSWALEVYLDRMRFRTWTAGEVSTFSIEPSVFDGVWTQIAGVYDGVDNHTFVNGILHISANQTGTLRSNSNKIGIGSYSLAPTVLEFKGLIEYIYVYNHALSASEIAQLYQEPFTFMQGDLPVSMMFDYGGAPAPTGQVIMISCVPIVLLSGSLLWMNRKKAA